MNDNDRRQVPTPSGITPPSPGLDREEPELRQEDDLPKGPRSPAPDPVAPEDQADA